LDDLFQMKPEIFRPLPRQKKKADKKKGKKKKRQALNWCSMNHLGGGRT